MKTKAQLALEAAGIDYEIRFYLPDSRLSAQQIASVTGIPAEYVYKTLVCRGAGHRTYVCVVPSSKTLDLKKVSVLFQEEHIRLAPKAALKEITGGYEKGSCTPIGMKPDYPVVLDENMKKISKVFLNGGKVGLLVGVAVDALAELTGGFFADLTGERSDG